MKNNIFFKTLWEKLKKALKIGSGKVRLRNQVFRSGRYKDKRDGRIYRTFQIGDQRIMSQNFAYCPGTGNFWVYNDDSGNLNKYGCLYDWETAKQIAPKGWHLPSEEEWSLFCGVLAKEAAFAEEEGNTSEKLYKRIIRGGNSGFNAELCGIRKVDGTYIFKDERANFWSSSSNTDGPVRFELDSKQDGLKHYSLDREIGVATLWSCTVRGNGFSVRLFKD